MSVSYTTPQRFFILDFCPAFVKYRRLRNFAESKWPSGTVMLASPTATSPSLGHIRTCGMKFGRFQTGPVSGYTSFLPSVKIASQLIQSGCGALSVVVYELYCGCYCVFSESCVLFWPMQFCRTDGLCTLSAVRGMISKPLLLLLLVLTTAKCQRARQKHEHNRTELCKCWELALSFHCLKKKLKYLSVYFMCETVWR